MITVLGVIPLKFLSQPPRVDDHGAVLPLFIECIHFVLNFVECAFVLVYFVIRVQECFGLVKLLRLSLVAVGAIVGVDDWVLVGLGLR